MAVLVTGGAGYIGSHAVHRLIEAGRNVVVVDDLSNGHRTLVPEQAEFAKGAVGNAELVRAVLSEYAVDEVVHFAASIDVAESVDEPLPYYENNFCATGRLVQTCVECGVSRFVFSSSAAVYGAPEEVPVDEETSRAPINPYGRSKAMVERMLADVEEAYDDFCYAALRYFNVAGADPDGRTGQVTSDSTHLVKVACEAALGERDYLEVYGDDYPTRDGTCVRDYIHVTDLVDAHVSVLQWLRKTEESHIFNCGYGRGFSVLEVADAVREVSGVDFEIRLGDRRPGDPPKLVADPQRLERAVEWEPKFGELESIVETALEWERFWRSRSTEERSS